MKVSQCKAQKCHFLDRIYNQECRQNNGPFVCCKAKRELVKNLDKCPKE